MSERILSYAGELVKVLAKRGLMQRADALMQRVPLNTNAAHFVLMQRAAALMRNGEYTGSNRGLIWEAQAAKACGKRWWFLEPCEILLQQVIVLMRTECCIIAI